MDVTSTDAAPHETFRKRLNEVDQASCELLFLSKEKDGCYKEQRYEPTTSARLFSLHSNPSNDDNDREYEDKQDGINGFATYVKVHLSFPLGCAYMLINNI